MMLPIMLHNKGNNSFRYVSLAVAWMAAILSVGNIDPVDGAAYLCPGSRCQENFTMSCADWFDENFIFDDPAYCCSFSETDDGNCTLVSTSNCQYDSKAKHNCTMPDENGAELPCPMVGPTAMSVEEDIEECPVSEVEIPDSSLSTNFMASLEDTASTSSEAVNDGGDASNTTSDNDSPEKGDAASTEGGDASPTSSATSALCIFSTALLMTTSALMPMRPFWIVAWTSGSLILVVLCGPRAA